MTLNARHAGVVVAYSFFACTGPASADTTYEHEQVGDFVVETEKYQNTGVPIMHAANSWTSVNLIWTSPDKGATVRVVDNGWQVSLEIKLAIPKSDRSCSSTSAPIGAIGKPPSTPAFWRWAEGPLDDLLKLCTQLDPARKAAYRSKFVAAAVEYPAAADAWKAASVRAFGSITHRCVRAETGYNPHPGARCVEWSGEQLTKANLAAAGAQCRVVTSDLRFRSNVEVEWRVRGQSLDEAKFACLLKALSPFKGVDVRITSDSENSN